MEALIFDNWNEYLNPETLRFDSGTVGKLSNTPIVWPSEEIKLAFGKVLRKALCDVMVIIRPRTIPPCEQTKLHINAGFYTNKHVIRI